jgi:hypothetical protein
VNSANAIAELCANLTTTFGLERVAIGQGNRVWN